MVIATDGTGNRYWLVTSDGQVTLSPRNRSYGSVARKRLSGHIVGIAAKVYGTGKAVRPQVHSQGSSFDHFVLEPTSDGR